MSRVYPVRFLTVSRLKGNKSPLADAPKEGTNLRAIYDLFVNNPGIPIAFNSDQLRRDPRTFMKLRDFWGLDIKRLQNGNYKTGRKSLYILVAYWDGNKYVDCNIPDDITIPLLRE